jgi:hypothetical protein
MSDSLPSSVDHIKESLETFQELNSIINEAQDPRLAAFLRSKNNNIEQKGGLTIISVFQACINVIFQVLIAIVKFIYGIFKELFFLPWKQSNRALFWKYLWFCIKCGFYLCIFAVAGPIFIVIGIFMVYRKLLDKMGVDGPQLIRQRLTEAREL